MKRRTGLIMLITIVFLVLVPAVNQAAMFDSQKSIEGTVKDVTSNLLTVTSQAAEHMRISEIQLEVSPDTEYEKLNNLTELKEGDKVKVEYREERNKKIATHIAKLEGRELKALSPGRI